MGPAPGHQKQSSQRKIVFLGRIEYALKDMIGGLALTICYDSLLQPKLAEFVDRLWFYEGAAPSFTSVEVQFFTIRLL
jgi:hypothetical protein